MAAMRVLQVIETGGPGGAETIFANLSTALQERGHHVHCMAGEGSWLPLELSSRGLSHELIVSETALDPVLLRSLRAAIRRERIDVVHAHLFDGAVYAALAARLEGRRCVVTLHGQVDVNRAGWRTRIKRWVLQANASVIVTVSEALRRDISAALHIPKEKFVVVPNGVRMPSSVRPADAPTGPVAIDDRTARIVALGNIRRPKNYPMLLEAFAVVRRDHPRATLHIAGQEDRDGLYESLRERVRQPDLDGAVVFHGFVADPEHLLHGADAFVLASTQEGFSLATIEAMLAAVPVVATRSGGPEEILRDGETGLLVPVNDVPALAAALCRILDDRALATALTAAAYHDAHTRFSMDAMVERYVELYR